jgi:hypothetical protein
VGRFLRGLNAVFNAAIAIKRIDAELAIIPQFHSTQLALQAERIRLANIEVGDAIRVLSEVPGLNVSSLSSFEQASTQLNIVCQCDRSGNNIHPGHWPSDGAGEHPLSYARSSEIACACRSDRRRRMLRVHAGTQDGYLRSQVHDRHRQRDRGGNRSAHLR